MDFSLSSESDESRVEAAVTVDPHHLSVRASESGREADTSAHLERSVLEREERSIQSGSTGAIVGELQGHSLGRLTLSVGSDVTASLRHIYCACETSAVAAPQGARVLGLQVHHVVAGNGLVQARSGHGDVGVAGEDERGLSAATATPHIASSSVHHDHSCRRGRVV